jgi:hypothetical protein
MPDLSVVVCTRVGDAEMDSSYASLKVIVMPWGWGGRVLSRATSGASALFGSGDLAAVSSTGKKLVGAVSVAVRLP